MEQTAVNVKAIRLIEYIRDLSRLRYKPVTTYERYEDVLFVSKLPEEPECRTIFEDASDEWLYVRKPAVLPRLHVPEEIADWIIADHKKYTYTYRPVEEGDVPLDKIPEEKAQVESFLKEEWEPYATEGRRRKQVQDTYDHLFEMYQLVRNNAETLELVVSAGLLQWPKSAVRRHVLSAQAELTFNKEAGEFMIVPAGNGLQFMYEDDMLPVEDQLSREEQEEVVRQLELLESIGDTEAHMQPVLTKIANGLDAHGRYVHEFERPRVEGDDPVLSFSPAFILRKKGQKSFQQACETAIEQLGGLADDQIPDNLLNMVHSLATDSFEDADDQPYKEPEEFYFPLASNEEQNRIISTLSHRNSVLVQGPPGTGKTHTIANLISHFLATGERILITSQTAKALDVLKDKLPEGLQSLTVSLLGGDAASMKDLEKVVDTISTNKEQMDLDAAKETIEQQKKRRKEIRAELARIKTELFELREKETYEHAFPEPYKGTALEIAKKVRAGADAYAWYQSDVTFESDSAVPEKERALTQEYLAVYHRDMVIPEAYSAHVYPRFPEELDPAGLPDTIAEAKRYKKEVQSFDLAAPVETRAKQLTPDVQDYVLKEVSRLEALNRTVQFHSYAWLSGVRDDLFADRGLMWEDVHRQLTESLQVLEASAEKAELSLLEKGSLSTAALYTMTNALTDHVKNGGSLGGFLIKPKIVRHYKQELGELRYQGKPVKTERDLEAVTAAARVLYAQEQIAPLLEKIGETIHDSSVTYVAEVTQITRQLASVMALQEWRKTFLSTVDTLANEGLTFDETLQLRKDVQRLQALEKMHAAERVIEQHVTWLASIQETDRLHRLYAHLQEALEKQDEDRTAMILETYHHFQELVERDAVLSSLMSKILSVAPWLGQALQEDPDRTVWGARLQRWPEAVVWRQVLHWTECFANRSEHELSLAYDAAERELKALVKETGELKAWTHMLEHMTDQQSKHLKAWAQQVKKIGKGTGKNAARHRARAQEHMEQCMDAIPAWIMPMYQVFDYFEVRPNLFDIVIIDEASQSWHDALLLKYLARKMIIVGDNQQISPTIIGITAEDIDRLGRRHFGDIDFPFGKDLDLNSSFFDTSYVMFRDTISLREHFRCMPEIIGFSNRISYQNKPLIPLRQYPANRLEPLKTVYLPHGVREGSSSAASNEAEADAIVASIAACLEDPAYDGKTFGVISLLGSNQAKLIQSKLIESVGAEVMEDRRILCGDAYVFQGDERDVIFLSMVASATGQTRLSALTRMSDRQRFNVAASRAKDQLWLVTSLTVNDVSNRDCMRYQLLAYFANPLKEEAEANREKCESQFERDVFDRITARGYRVIPQYEVAGYRLDLVVQGQKSRLVVECDGDYWHTAPEDQERDFLRERVLQRAGWQFWRVLGSTFYLDPEHSLESLWATLDEMGIEPYVEWGSAGEDAGPELVEMERS